MLKPSSDYDGDDCVFDSHSKELFSRAGNKIKRGVVLCSAKHAISLKLSEACRSECLDTRFPRPTLLCGRK